MAGRSLRFTPRPGSYSDLCERRYKKQWEGAVRDEAERGSKHKAYGVGTIEEVTGKYGPGGIAYFAGPSSEGKELSCHGNVTG